MFVLNRLLVAWALSCPALALAADSITLTTGEWMPYMSQKAPEYGPVLRIVTAAFALEGVKVNYVFRPWSRAYLEADSAEANGSAVWSSSPRDTDRNRRFNFSDVIFDNQSVFFHARSHPFRWTSYDQLPGLKMGGTAGYEYEFDQQPGITMDRTATSDALNFRKLAAGRFDVFPASLDVGRYILRHELSPEQAALISWDPRPYNMTRYHLVLNKKNPANQRYMALFNHGLKKLKDSGKYAKYMQEVRAQ